MERDLEISTDLSGVFVLTLIFAFGLFMGICMIGAEDSSVHLGDEVTTTDRYTTLFNDSFTGRVVAKYDGMYTVRDENGAEREFEKYWLEKRETEEI